MRNTCSIYGSSFHSSGVVGPLSEHVWLQAGQQTHVWTFAEGRSNRWLELIARDLSLMARKAGRAKPRRQHGQRESRRPDVFFVFLFNSLHEENANDLV